ncbi:FAD-dependent oxidoreductase, partial [Candidatus Aerophobetes bacterium]|nr:FAD-dependent oxidoreductase [Candidatus Aerophobetes bacterium]
MRKAELLIIGAGPAGYVAAIRASQLGAETVLVEKNTVGGTCLNRGCIPTKSLLSSVEVLNLARRAQEFGLEVDKVRPNLSSMVRRKDRIVDQLRRGVHYLLRANKISLVQGRAQFLSPHRIKID